MKVTSYFCTDYPDAHDGFTRSYTPWQVAAMVLSAHLAWGGRLIEDAPGKIVAYSAPLGRADFVRMSADDDALLDPIRAVAKCWGELRTGTGAMRRGLEAFDAGDARCGMALTVIGLLGNQKKSVQAMVNAICAMYPSITPAYFEDILKDAKVYIRDGNDRDDALIHLLVAMADLIADGNDPELVKEITLMSMQSPTRFKYTSTPRPQ